MKICAISDTHTKHKKLRNSGGIPECDILIHAGDFTWNGKFWEVRNFLDWLTKQPARHKVIIAGNHEETLDKFHPKYNPAILNLFNLYDDICYLENSAIEIDGLKIYGTPWTPWFHDWGFNGLDVHQVGYRNGPRLKDIYENIPNDTDIIICHGPPYDILDKSDDGDRCGSVDMRRILESNRLENLFLYITGHIHESRGTLNHDDITFCNVASLARDYQTISPPVIIDIEGRKVQNISGYDNQEI